MTSRKRLRQLFTGKPSQNDAAASLGDSSSSQPVKSRTARRTGGRNLKRKHLLETLESRQMFAGPQLIGIQPNEGDLIVEGTTRNVAPRSLTFRFDEVQQIDPATFGGIQITRSGVDKSFGTTDDVRIVPGLVTLGDIRQNEVVVRFAENLPDDNYRISISSFDDSNRGITALRNLAGEALQPSVPGARSEIVNFELNLGALVESVVPQPVVRLANGTLEQRRNEVLVYFNDDSLFVENDPVTRQPTARSAENTRFYQLLMTRDTVRTTDDLLFFPDRVIYDEPTNTARLIFASDINNLPGVPLGGGTFRLRVGSAVDGRSELILPPTNFAVSPSVTSDLRIDPALKVTFRSTAVGEAASGRTVGFVNTGNAGLTVSVSSAGNIVFNLGGSTPSVANLISIVAATPSVAAVLTVTSSLNGVAGTGGSLLVPTNIVNSPALVMTAAGDTITTSLDVGVFGLSGQPITSVTIRESIDPEPYQIQLPGATSDPGRLEVPEFSGAGLLQTINQNFGADIRAGVTEIPYNFQAVFEDFGGVSQLNQIGVNELYQTRVREALSLWANYIGVQFRETADQGITFAFGDTTSLRPRPNTQLTSPAVLNASLRIDPTFNESVMVFSNQVAFGTSYGEDLFRKAMTGIGFLLGLEGTTDLTAQSLISLNSAFLNATINPATQGVLTDLEPSFPGNYDILHGSVIHRPDSIDVDLYRFEVNLGPGIGAGTLTAETFAERLPDSSLLDTTLTLFEDVKASVTTDFNVGTALSVKFTAVQPGSLGNSSRLEFVRTDRAAGDSAIRISRGTSDNGQPAPNVIVVDVPRRSANVPSVTVGSIVAAVNNDPFASTLFDAEILVGSPNTDVSGVTLNYSPLVLSGGGVRQLSRNDDYFSEDSLLKATLPNGVYYIGIAASGNDSYDPAIAKSGFGGKTQGAYELLLKFEPQVNDFDSIRDLDSARAGVPGTALDGDGDGLPGGVKNFWFQTRPTERTIEITDSGAAVTPGQSISITGSNGAIRRFEFVPTGGSATVGSIPIFYNPGPPTSSGSATPSANLAASIRSAINSVQGETGVRASLSPNANNVLTLAGERLVQFSSNFRGAEVYGRTIFVDKTAAVTADGSLANPFNNIAGSNVPNAFSASLINDIVRIVGNGGLDNDPSTAADNFSYKIGVNETGGGTLEDGRNMQIPMGVTVMIDAGAAFKLRNSAISVGSTSLLADRSGGALQVLGAPRLVNLTSPVIDAAGVVTNKGITPRVGAGDVVFTSTRDRSVDAPASGNAGAPAPGNWGGLIFRRDLDQAEGRVDLEDEGIFLQSVNHADIRFGGGSNILIDSIQQAVNPIQMVNLRPNITFNRITDSANAAMSAAPDSFEETSYQSPRFQAAGTFTADYDRVGPDINNNLLNNNSINGLFVRVETSSATPPRQLTVAGRFDDIDIVHYIAENVIVAGTPGGSIADGVVPSVSSVAGQPLAGGSLAAGTYNYRITFVDAFGFESQASNATSDFTVTANSSLTLINLPAVNAGLGYIFRRVYRRDLDGIYRLAGQLDAGDNGFVDDGGRSGSPLDLTRSGVRGRLDGSLVIDPGSVVKFRGARIELGQGTQLLAEGSPSQPIVFTSSLDDRFGAGGSFDTNNDNLTPNGAARPASGDWSGFYAGPTSHVSFDNSVIAYGGGVSLLEGGQSRGFAALELQQATARVVDSRFEFNANGQLGAGPIGRNGRLGITPATIFARFTQPTIVGNTFVDNRGSIIDIDSDSFGDNFKIDLGRQTGNVDRLADLDDNQGPLIRRNVTDSVAADAVAGQQLNGLEVRGGILSTGSVWDDTDIVHMLFDSITVGNLISNTGLRLKSRPDESLVIKLSGAGTPNSPTIGTGFAAVGSTSNITDRIGGTVQVIGLPGAPVVLTSIHDDTVGAGRRIDGTQQTDTNGNSFGSRPAPNDWRSLYFDQFSNDRNVAVRLEQETSTAVAPGLNGTVTNAQVLGELADRIESGNETLRLGFEVQGFLSEPTDIDVYSFQGTAGTPVWIDIDRTSYSLDTIIEVLDADGNVVARVDNSFAEVDDPSTITVVDPSLQGRIGSLRGTAEEVTRRGAGGLYEDIGSANPRDAGLRLALPGITGARSVYFFRVRSASINPSDSQGGLSRGAYSFQVRLQEAQEFAGSVVQFADIRYANHGIHIQGLPGSSPLLGEVQENEAVAGVGNAANNNLIDNADALFSDVTPTGQRPQFVGNLANASNGTFSIGGSLSTSNDVDFYHFDVDFAGQLGALQKSTVFDIDYADGFSRPDTNISVFYDDDFETGINPPRLILFGQSSNIFEDQTSPLGANLGEILSRGSVSTGDPFIGPVSLPEGSYYVAITSATNVPTELAGNPLVRREPINSIQRIFEDRVNAGASNTAAGPLLPRMFTDVSITSGGFEISSLRAADPGHGIPQPFDNSVTGVTFANSIVPEIETGNLVPGMDLDATGIWTIADNANIGSSAITGSSNTSTSIPHTTISGNLFGQLSDFFTISIPDPGTRVIVDLDEGFNPFQGIDDTDPLTPPFIPDVNSADFDLVLIRPNPNGVGFQFVPGLPQRFATSNVNDGRAGSVSNLDPFFDVVLDQGIYFIGVVKDTTTVAIDNNGVLSVGGPTSNDGSYILHVSVENHAIDSTGNGGDTVFFNRQTAAASGSLVSEPFSLAGYVAADEPVFYYNYLYAPAVGDAVTLVVTSDQNPTGTTIADSLLVDDVWRQNRVSLRDFAGQTNVRVTFNYTISNVGVVSEGLHLDDFVVGFAERGEVISYARGGEDGFSGAFAGIDGEYQLELRPGTDFATPATRLIGGIPVPGVNLTQTFDTNDRQAQQITIVAPAGDQLLDGDRFTIGDGLNQVVFEFSTDASVGFGNVRIPFTAADSASVVAGNLIRAINNPATQARLRVEAATSAGISSGVTTDARVALSGQAVGNFLQIATFSDAPPAGTRVQIATDGSIRLPAIFHNGLGDLNKPRAQGQVLIDSNRISDVRAIGIWSEPGVRDIDIEDRRQNPLFQSTNPFVTSTAVTNQNPFLQQPPVGNTYPGAVLNLPTLNDDVIGGLASGVVVVNNVIDQAGFAGVKIDGETRPIVLEGAITPSVGGSFQTFIPDGFTMAIDSGGTRVVFEFEDISGAPVDAGGSGAVGGDGFVDGHVPIYYRLDSASTYNPSSPAPNRNYANSNLELMLSIMQSIQGSILMTNGLVELVTPTIGPSLTRRNELVERSQRRPEGFPTAALYLQGAAGVYFTSIYQKRGFAAALTQTIAPVAEAPQPVARIINNTIYGADGTESAFSRPGTDESNDTINDAVDTKVGRAHRPAYTSNAQIGDNAGPLTNDRDVDFYKVELSAGDRLIVDIDTVGGGPDTVLRLFDSQGIAQGLLNAAGDIVFFNEQGTAPGYLDPASTVNAPAADVVNPRDGFIDFTATKTGTYYVGVSSSGNTNYDPLSLSGRTAGTGGTGDYTIGLEVYAPRTFVLSVDDQNNALGGGNTGTRGSDLIGTTFTITQIPDYVGTGRYAGVVPTGNQVTFVFNAAGDVVANGQIAVPLIADYRVPDIMRAISNAINGFANNPALGNHEGGNGPDDRSGPVRRVEANALGGIDGDNLGIANLSRGATPLHYLIPSSSDLRFGYGHDRLENPGGNAHVAPGGTNLTNGDGTTELYALVERAARIDISPEARAAGLRLTPDATVPAFATESDQLLTEFGVLIGGGSSSTLLNNVFVNLHQSVVAEESSITGFGQRLTTNQFNLLKAQTVIVTGNTFQYDETRNTLIRANLNWLGGQDTGLSTDAPIGPSNVNGAGTDFNQVIGNNTLVLENAAGNRFLPSSNSPIIDNAIDSLIDRDPLIALKQSVGIPASNVLAPVRDNNGLLRADNPFVSNPGGIGQNVFKDRGALDRTDFVGPVAILDVPRDNDAEGIDTDPATSFVQLSGGVYDEFRILLQDLGDPSDPFVGTGIDDDTVVVPVINGLRASGSVVALFEGDRLLAEGIDYTFSYDTTKNLITLRPIAGIWRNDRAYRVAINNRDRIVAVAPAAGQVVDGDSFAVIDTQGGRVTFEYDSGYQLTVPETLSFTVPAAGTGAGGIADGDLFSITGVDGLPVVFEFNRDSTTLANVREVRFNLTDTPAAIATSARLAIAAATAAGLLNVDVNVAATGPTVVIGSNAGTVLDASRSGLLTNARTLALRVPIAGAGPTGVADGDVLTINDGNTTVSFEFEINGGLNNPANVAIPIAAQNADGVLAAIRTAIDNSALRLSPVAIGSNLFLGLPANGFASVSRGNLTPIGISRTAAEGDVITFTPSTGAPVRFELTTDALITPGNIRVDYSRLSTGDQLAAAIAAAIQSQTIAGLDTQAVQANPGGLVSIGGRAGLGLSITPNSTIIANGQPDVTGPTLLSIFGPLLLQIPIVGGSGIPDDSQFTLTNGANTVTFIYNVNLTGVGNINATPITYQTFEDANTLANATVAAINASNLGIVATNLGNGQISLGAIADNQLTFPAAPLVPAPLAPRRGIVVDQDQVTITQGATTRTFEFELAVGGGGVTPGAIPVVFQATNTIDQVAGILAAAINNNRGPLNLTATALPGGQVRIVDTPQTVTVVSNPATIRRSGQPGGALPIAFTGSFTAEDIKRSTIDAINNARAAGITSLSAEDRGGATYFIENGIFVDGPLPNYFLEGVKDLAGQLLEPTRDDNTTQFTLLLPTIGLDYGDAPDPFGGVRGRYPTLLDVDGPRHLVSDQVRLGSLIDVDTNGLPNPGADGDDTTIFIIGTPSAFFNASVQNGFVEIAFVTPPSIPTADGSTITLSTGVKTVTFELDTDGIFNENNFAISLDGSLPISREMIAQAFVKAVNESPLSPARVFVPDNIVGGLPVPGNTVRVVTDDEDGVTFVSQFNPTGVLNRGIPTPITVTATGGGILEAWIDFNFDGDFTDPGEQIIDRFTTGAVFSANALGTPVTREFIINVPTTAPIPASVTTTYARFRISAEGGLAPTGLALSGEVEDYRLTILSGLPPTVNNTNSTLAYTVDEDGILQARDADGTLTPASANDNGALAAIRDPDGDAVGVFAGDLGTRTLLSPSGATAGLLTLFADGTYTFVPATDFFGTTSFTFRVTDLKPGAPATQLVSPVAMTVNLTVTPVNDRPFVSGAAPSITRTIAEDAIQTFTREELTAFYSQGPANESTQTLVIQSAGVNGLGFQTLLGGTLTLTNGNLVYRPPANFPGPGPDQFTYVVADDPNDVNQLVQSAQTLGTITINITNVNDAPIAGTDTYTAAEDAPFNIPVSGLGGILTNDVAGPADEVNAGQTVSLVRSVFPKPTLRGGTVSLNASGTMLTYTPAANFSGQDQFTYDIVDTGSPAQTASGTVLINIGGDNDAPVFVGINGNPAIRSLNFNESKEQEQVITYNLSSWFSDPEGDLSTFVVTSRDTTLVRSVVTRDNATGISTLTLTLPSFRFGATSLDVVATNVGGPSGSAVIPVTVVNTPDPPTVIGSLNPVLADEDAQIIRNLATVFNDPDGSQLTYKVTRLGQQLNPTAAQIAASPLVLSILFNGDLMTITLDENASGSVDVEISASDGTFEVRDSFTLTVAAVPDAPRDPQGTDFYNVPVGARFEIIDPSIGLNGDDVDPDGDFFPGSNRTVQVEIASLTQPTKGTLVVNPNGTFSYTNTSGMAGETDSFTYRPIDPTGRVGNSVTVTFNLGRSRYQNPIPGFEADVTANGVISPLDALRIINRIADFRRANPPSVPFSVSLIATAPPDFLDVNGDGLVTPLDALRVINKVAEQNRIRLGGGEGELATMLSSTVAYAAQSSIGLPQSNRVVSEAQSGTVSSVEAYDPFAAGFDVVDGRLELSTEELFQLDQSEESVENTSIAIDEILSEWSDPINL